MMYMNFIDNLKENYIAKGQSGNLSRVSFYKSTEEILKAFMK